MDRRQFLTTGLGAVTSVGTLPAASPAPIVSGRVRDLFPGLGDGPFLNAAAGTPLSRFSEYGLRRLEEAWRQGYGSDAWRTIRATLDDARGRFARMIGAEPAEIALVHCTKAGEQIVLDGLPALREGGNVVTNDLHFAGSLHNLDGLRRAGMDVRIVRARDWDLDLQAMEEAIDERTALVSITLVSNVNGRVELLPELAEIAHARGAFVYADVIQAAGVFPFDVRALGIDFAACSGYKWLYGPHGAGFLFVREELQGSALQDRLFPGHVRPNYPPWVEETDPELDELAYHAPQDAARYQPGHVSYLGYFALAEALGFLEEHGVEKARAHSVRLNRRLLDGLDPERYRCISPDVDRSPIVAFEVQGGEELGERLAAAEVSVSLYPRRLRVSPAIYNDEADVDALIEVLNQT